MNSAKVTRSFVPAQIVDMYGRLAQAADYGTIEEYAELLADDVVWEHPSGSNVGLPAQIRRGRTDVLAGVEERRSAGIQGPGTGTWHVVTNICVTPSDGEAQSSAYWFIYESLGETPVVRRVGRYRDRFVEVGASWVLAHRVISWA